MTPTELRVRPVPTHEIGNDQGVITADDREYWSGNNPQAIVFASSSIRKGMLLALALGGYNLESIRKLPFLEELPFDPTDATTPLELQQLLEQHIPNGNGELKESVYVGEFRGVPVYMVPQEGETDRNDDPKLQSTNKVFDVHANIGNKRVVIFGSDSTGLINGVHLGKPRHYPGKVGRFERGGLDVDYSNPAEVLEYSRAYLEEFYLHDTESVHNNALVAVRVGENGQERMVVRETSLMQQIRGVKERLDELQIYLDAGGGGLFQLFFEWYEDIMDQLSDILMREAIAQLPEEQQRWAVISHIMGMPAWALPSVFEELTEKVSEVGQADVEAGTVQPR